jgi:hypothetical protein
LRRNRTSRDHRRRASPLGYRFETATAALNNIGDRMMRILLATVMVATFAVNSPANDIEALQSVGEHSRGTAEARAARDSLVRGGSKNLLPMLKGFQDSSVLATNWLRSAFESIADAEIKAGRSLPKDELLEFVKTTSQSPDARRLAYEWLLKGNPDLKGELIPGMLLDPSPEFRRDAVALLIDQAGSLTGEKAVMTYKKALTGAVHEDQVKTIASALRESEVDVDLQKHFGFLATWKVIGPFDNKAMKGFPIAYEPEQEIELSAEYEGQLGAVSWQPIATEDDYGIVNIGEQIENYKGSVMYATTTYRSGKEQSVELRLGTPNAWKLWVNGELVFEREEYHRSSRMDQYKIPVTLKSGPNRILLKVCQNEQTQPWAQDYKFQLRVCDATGSAVLPAATSADLGNNNQGTQR